VGCVRSTAPSGADPRCAAIEGEIPPQNLATFANPKTLVAVETETWWQTIGSLHWELADQMGPYKEERFRFSPRASRHSSELLFCSRLTPDCSGLVSCEASIPPVTHISVAGGSWSRVE